MADVLGAVGGGPTSARPMLPWAATVHHALQVLVAGRDGGASLEAQGLRRVPQRLAEWCPSWKSRGNKVEENVLASPSLLLATTCRIALWNWTHEREGHGR